MNGPYRAKDVVKCKNPRNSTGSLRAGGEKQAGSTICPLTEGVKKKGENFGLGRLSSIYGETSMPNGGKIFWSSG